MRLELLEIMRCPQTGKRLILENPIYSNGRVESGWLVSEDGHQRYLIRGFIPRFVSESNYANNFGMQWNKFRQTQLDSYSGHSISADRFWKATGWRPEDIAGKWVLDAGCGAGRFAEVALEAGAKVVALDYSSAVDACYANLRHHQDFHVVQGDIYALPFLKAFFPFVYSLGVLQHTPDVAKAFSALTFMVSRGGLVCVDFYEKTWKRMLLPKFWLRPITKRMPQEKLFMILETLMPNLLPLSRLLAKVPILGGGLKRLVPVANYEGILPLSERQLFEWSLLDTFDWLAPQFDNPQTEETVRRWMEKAGLEQCRVFKASHLVGCGRMPKTD
ncbi:MAG: methyltransferase domain-containing protein [Candidatus Omnitrophica bacterium]|nr:methyltransferase domain-containing protein [Patescibacteria group bacterium]MBU1811357.1 methyltransferase domain-containing protein [Candidatus Omnitrophota bacterium]